VGVGEMRWIIGKKCNELVQGVGIGTYKK
jgi:hypothetical protein